MLYSQDQVASLEKARESDRETQIRTRRTVKKKIEAVRDIGPKLDHELETATTAMMAMAEKMIAVGGDVAPQELDTAIESLSRLIDQLKKQDNALAMPELDEPSA